MAIISFTNYKRGQTTGCMSAVMRYTMQDKKTEFEGQQLVTGINCQPESVYADFMTTKRLYHKTDGVLFYHMVQSFPKGEAVDPVTAHAAALKLAEYYEGYEVLVCTHTDREHIHSHFLINSVNFDTGRKLHIAKEQLQELRQRNDMVCKEFSLPVFQPREQKQKTKTMTIGEYHTAARGQSKKLQLMNIINDCMRHASNREEFIALMESEGYKVRWEKSRKNITYTTPSGWQCRNRLLFGDKYLKENMEYEFRIREEIIYGRAHGPEPARAFTAADSAGVEFTDHAHCHPVSAAGGSDDADTEDRIHRVGSAWNAGVSSEPEITHRPDSGAEQHGGDPEIVDGDDHSAGTGWEEERKAFLQMAGLASGLRPDRSGQMDRTGTEVAKEIRGVERELSTMRKRDGELDVVFKRMYEDSALGRVSNEQFRLLSEAYSKEKAQLAEAIPATEERLEKLRSSMANAKNFIAKARKFTDMTELTPELLRTFVAKIIVYEKEVKYSKHAAQKIHICFRDFNLNETDDMLLCGETTEKADSTIALPA